MRTRPILPLLLTAPLALLAGLSCAGSPPNATQPTVIRPDADRDVKPLLSSQVVRTRESTVATQALSPPSKAAITPNADESSTADDKAVASLSVEQKRELDSVSKSVLQRELFQKRNLADIGLLPKKGPLYLLYGGPTHPMSEKSFPRAGRRRLQLVSMSELQAIADKDNRTVSYISLHIGIDGSTADVRSGVDIVTPTNSRAASLCCCIKFTDWKRTKNKWRPVRNADPMIVCS